MKSNILNTIKTDLFCNIHKTPLYKVNSSSIAVCLECEKENRKVSEQNHIKKMSNDFFDKKILSVKIPLRHKNCRFKNFIIDNMGQNEAYSHVLMYTKSILNGQSSNILMYGKTGTGKTHLACSVAHHLVKNNKSVRYITSENLATEIMDSWNKIDKTEKSVIQEFTDFDLLIIDEYGLHDVTNHKKLELIQKVLNSRYENMKPVMLISNLDEQQVQETIGHRNWSRLQQDGFKNVSFNWSDYRSLQSN